MRERVIANHWKPFLRHQWEAFSWNPVDNFGTVALLGGWGSGKTHGAARLAFRMALENPWRSCYGSEKPLGIILAPTFKILNDSTIRQFNSVCPKGSILKRRGSPHNDIIMTNGFRWVLYSGEAELEGMDACCVWVDEISHSTFSRDPNLYSNLLLRLRDPFAQSFRMIVSGLPTAGFVRDTFDRDTPQHKCILAGTLANSYLPKSTVSNFLDSCPDGQQEQLIGGRWITPPGAVYPQYDADLHLTDDTFDNSKPVHLGIDVGNLGAVLACQVVTVKTKDMNGVVHEDKSLLVGYQHLSESESIEAQLMTLKKEHPLWQISTVCSDPTIRRDEIAAIKKHYPNAMLIKRDRSHQHFPVETGIRIVQRGLRDALGNVRIRFHRSLAKDPRGIVSFLTKYRRHDISQDPVKDNRTDHVGDCLRYLACYLIPPIGNQVKVLTQRGR